MMMMIVMEMVESLTFDFEQRLRGCIANFVFGHAQKSSTVIFPNSVREDEEKLKEEKRMKITQD